MVPRAYICEYGPVEDIAQNEDIAQDSAGVWLGGGTVVIRWRKGKTALVVAVAVVLGLNLVQALNGCSGDSPAMGRFAEAVGMDPYSLNEDGSRELARFNAVFTTYASDSENTRQLKHFRDAYKRVRATYVHEVTDAELVDAAIDGVNEKNPEPGSMAASALVEAALDSMTASLDPHSAYLNSEEYREMNLVMSGQFGGLGIKVMQENKLIKVISPIEDTPAYRAGLKPGDLITHIDGKPVREMSLRDAVYAMRGEPGTNIRLTIERAEKAPFDVAITRAIITVRPVKWRVENDIGYLRIVSFNEKVEDDVEEAMIRIREGLGSRGRGLVLDLRNNPGGALDQSLAVADDFLEQGIIVSIRGRNPEKDHAFAASAGDLSLGLPMVVLINAGSASASEIVAAALQDHGRATVMGTRSFGKGSVQTVMRLPVDGALKLTTALYYGPSGETIQAAGIEPDIILNGVEENPDFKREADLPGALPEQGDHHYASKVTLDGKACPAVGKDEDRELGCAIALLRAGSTDRFLASLGQ